jgi:hypothetical protein
VAASSLISVPFGRLILKNDIAANKYCESLVPVLEVRLIERLIADID